jgi:hypothetical protein
MSKSYIVWLNRKEKSSCPEHRIATKEILTVFYVFPLLKMLVLVTMYEVPDGTLWLKIPGRFNIN